MQLRYYNEELNFGDALNKKIFEHYIPELLDDNNEVILLGIGTVLGLEKGDTQTKKIVVFSSGYGSGDEKTYGTAPVIDQRYDIFCVRGPLTAQKFNLDPQLAITDGAILLRGMPLPRVEKEYEWSYMPHHISDKMYPYWKEVVEKAGGHFISAINEPEQVIEQILKSKRIVAEAMHGAIVADVLRVPWIPVSAYGHINHFKWTDWLTTMSLEYKPRKLISLFGKEKARDMVQQKTSWKPGTLPNTILTTTYMLYQNARKKANAITKLKGIAHGETFLSKEEVLEQKYQRLFGKIQELKNKYQK